MEDNLFSEDNEIIPEIDGEIIEDTSEICERCMSTGYVREFRDGVVGVVFALAGTDAEGKERRRLVTCNHGRSYGI